jgi:hypothetical protein
MISQKLMKKLSVILLVATTMACSDISWAQQQPAQSSSDPRGRSPLSQPAEPQLRRFDLNFRGGTPGQLIKAIEQSMGKPLNVIIPNESAEMERSIPPLVMNSVTVPELFNALSSASSRQVTIRSGNSYQYFNSFYTFKTEGNPHEDSIWYFHVEEPSARHELQTVQFFQLEPYLAKYKVEDITTAIETGWKMLGEEPYPKLSFHKDTKLLIAVGDPNKLANIQAVLIQLPKDNPAAEQAPTSPKSNDPHKL